MLPVVLLPLVSSAIGLHPMVDRHMFPDARWHSFQLHSPERKDVVLSFDRPWEGKESGYATVVAAPDGYRLYYRGGGETTREVTCLALSSDAVSWSRRPQPAENLEWQPPTDSNIIFAREQVQGLETHNLSPFLDSNPKAKPYERWKAVSQSFEPEKHPNRKKVLVTLVSPDGIHWKRNSPVAAVRDGGFDSQNLAFWDEVRREYVCYFRAGRRGLRAVRRVTSPDFVTWGNPEWVEFPSLPDTQLYTNGITPYPSVPGLYVAMPMRFVPQRRQVGDPSRPTDGVSDAVIAFSRDGLLFQNHFGDAWIRPGRAVDNWGNAHGNNTPVAGILTTSDTWHVFWMEAYGSIPRVVRGEIRPHGFVSLNAGSEAMELRSRVLTGGKRLQINFSTSAAGRISFALLNVDGSRVPGFGFDECGEVYGDELSRTVRWQGREMGDSGQKEYRLAIRMKESDLYAVVIR